MAMANNREEMWIMASNLFPTDWIENTEYSLRAGYPIYTSTVDGNGSWISDLGNRLELNIQNGKRIDSVNIWLKSKELYRDEMMAELRRITKELYS